MADYVEPYNRPVQGLECKGRAIRQCAQCYVYIHIGPTNKTLSCKNDRPLLYGEVHSFTMTGINKTINDVMVENTWSMF